MACDALGLPLRMLATPGNRNDITMAHELIEAIPTKAVLADKGYDADHLLNAIDQKGAQAVIPSRIDRKVQRQHDTHIYKQRHLIENLFSKLKQFRRVATRYDKLLQNFMGFVKLAAIIICLK